MNVNPTADAVALEAANKIEAALRGRFPGGAPQRKARVQCLVREAIDRATVRQAGAYKSGLDAAKAAAYQMELNAVNLFKQCGPEALEAERETNERLTNRVLQLEDALEKFRELYKEVNDLFPDEAAERYNELVEEIAHESPRPD